MEISNSVKENLSNYQTKMKRIPEDGSTAPFVPVVTRVSATTAKNAFEQ